jgi:hypothetical protein
MPARQISACSDGSNIEYDTGKFDDWCVYLQRPNENRHAPRDPQYFQFFSDLAEQLSSEQIYNDFIRVYEATNHQIEQVALDLIKEIASGYSNFAADVEVWLTVIYAGMVAEQNKAYTKLGKRIKRLGMCQLLMEGMSVNQAANFSKGKKWQELDILMKEKGF